MGISLNDLKRAKYAALQQITDIDAARMALKRQKIPDNLSRSDISLIQKCRSLYLGNQTTYLLFHVDVTKNSDIPNELNKIDNLVDRLNKHVDQINEARRIFAEAEINQFIQKMSDSSRYKDNPEAKQALLSQFKDISKLNLPLETLLDIAESIPSWKALLKKPRYVPGEKLKECWATMLGPDAGTSLQNPVSLLLEQKSKLGNPNSAVNQIWSFTMNVYAAIFNNPSKQKNVMLYKVENVIESNSSSSLENDYSSTRRPGDTKFKQRQNNPSNVDLITNILRSLDEVTAIALAEQLGRGPKALEIMPGTTETYLESVYPDRTTPKAIEFHRFLQENQITLLQNKNSKIFKVEPLDQTINPYCLKLEAWSMGDELKNRFDANPDAKTFMAPVYAEIETEESGFDAKIQVVPLYKIDVQTFLNKVEPSERLEEALHIFPQMARIYETFSKAHILFPDGKNSNWVMDEKNELFIVDQKSFTTKDENLSHFKDYFMSIPEKGPPFNIDAIHSLHLGKNMYQLLTGCSCKELYDPTYHAGRSRTRNYTTGSDAKNFNFDLDVFKTPEGKRFKSLIQQLIQLNPADRLPMSKAIAELAAINNLKQSSKTATQDYRQSMKSGREKNEQEQEQAAPDHNRVMPGGDNHVK